jgi:hypothetical protein
MPVYTSIPRVFSPMGRSANNKLVSNGLVLNLDAGNKLSITQNRFSNPTDIFAWCGSTGHNNVTVSRDTSISSPVGSSPLKFVPTGNDSHIGTYNSAPWNIEPAFNGQTWTVSVYAKASANTTGQIFIFGANNSGVSFVNGSWLGIATTTFNITTEWQRFQLSITFNNPDINFIHVRLDGPDTYTSPVDIWFDGLQVEQSNFATDFNGLSKNIWYDLSGNNNSGALTDGPSFNSANGGFVSFDGINDFVSVSNSSSLQVADTFTVNSWVFPTDLSNRFGVFSTRTLNTAGSWQLEIGTANGGQRRIAVTGLGTWVWESSNDVISINSWNNVCYVKPNNATQGGSMYLNGNLLTPLVTTAYTVLNNNDAKVIGRGTNLSQYFSGGISTIGLYNRALSATEIQQNFNAFRGRYGI